jgi:predicted amidohydrolase YtcJ
LSAVAAFTAISTCVLAQPAPQPPSQPCPAVRDVLVTNGRIHTMDTGDTIVESVRIVGDRFAEVGTSRLPTSRCTRTIDLEGRTAVPGLIDNHIHRAAGS